MSKPAAIKACFTHWVPVKGRSVLQLQFEIPIEEQAEILTYLGAPGNPGESKWVAIALLKPGPDQGSSHPEPAGTTAPGGQAGVTKEKTEGERALIRCVLLCKDTKFQLWASEQHDCDDFDNTADFVRSRCAIVSRSRIASDPAAMQRWLQLETKYLQDTDQLAEVRG